MCFSLAILFYPCFPIANIIKCSHINEIPGRSYNSKREKPSGRCVTIGSSFTVRCNSSHVLTIIMIDPSRSELWRRKIFQISSQCQLKWSLVPLAWIICFCKLRSLTHQKNHNRNRNIIQNSLLGSSLHWVESQEKPYQVRYFVAGIGAMPT